MKLIVKIPYPVDRSLSEIDSWIEEVKESFKKDKAITKVQYLLEKNHFLFLQITKKAGVSLSGEEIERSSLVTNHFNVLLPFKDLANAAAFLQKAGLSLRSRNNLVKECVGYLAALAEQDSIAVATDELSGIQFLIEQGLAGESGKARVKSFALVKQREQEDYEEAGKRIAAKIKADRKAGKKLELPQSSEADVLEAAQRSASQGETLEQFHEFALVAFGQASLESETLRKKVSKFFNQTEVLK